MDGERLHHLVIYECHMYETATQPEIALKSEMGMMQ